MISLKQRKIIAFPYSKYDALICDGAVRSGKTSIMMWAFVRWAMENFSGHRFGVCGRTVDSCTKNIIVPFTAMSLAKERYIIRWRRGDKVMEVRRGAVTNYFEVFGGKDEASYTLIQGRTLAGVLLDEVVLMPRSFVEQASARCSVSGSKLWFNCNPDHPNHWFYREWIRKTKEKHALYLHFTMADNPSLSKRVRQRYERMYSGAFYDRFVLGKWTAADGLVYPMFTPEPHVVPCDRYWISCDYGTVNPSSFGLWGHCDGTWYRLEEYYYDARAEGERRTDEEHYAALEQLAAGYDIETVVVDPSAASFIACIHSHGKFRVLPADNDVNAGIQQVSRLLLQDKLRVCESCRDIRREFSQYCWNDSIHGDAPKKEHDHAMDDMRYFVRTVVCRNPADGFFAVSAARR